jgi:hypothetical protein
MSNFVQSAEADYTSGTSLSKAFASNNANGNVLVACISYQRNDHPTSVTDSRGNTYVEKGFVNFATGNSASLWIATGCSAGANTVTVTLAGSAPAVSLIIAEYTNVNAVDQAAFGTGSSTSVSSPSVTTLHANETLVAYAVGNGSNMTAISPFTSRQQNVAGGYGDLEDRDVTSTGSYTATWSQGSAFGTTYGAIIASLYKIPAVTGAKSVVCIMQ